MELDLIYRGLVSPDLLQLLEIGNGPVADSDGFDLARVKNVLHLCPCLAQIPVTIHSSCAVRVDRQEFRGLVL